MDEKEEMSVACVQVGCNRVSRRTIIERQGHTFYSESAYLIKMTTVYVAVYTE